MNIYIRKYVKYTFLQVQQIMVYFYNENMGKNFSVNF